MINNCSPAKMKMHMMNSRNMDGNEIHPMAGLFLAYLYIQVYEMIFFAIIDTRSSDIPMIWKPKQVRVNLVASK